eukprot:SAG22_NODE_2581_length_2419_cov_1.480603_1_plen_159_part_00
MVVPPVAAMARPLLAAFLILLLASGAGAIDNGLGITPPRGWRSWNLFHGAINTSVMESQMAAVLDKSRTVGGVPTSLASLGFDWISMDGEPVPVCLPRPVRTALRDAATMFVAFAQTAGSSAIVRSAGRTPGCPRARRAARRGAARGTTRPPASRTLT